MVSVNVTPDGKPCIDPLMHVTHCVLNEPRSMSEPLRKVSDPTGVNDSVKPSNAQLVVVHPPPLNEPVVEKVAVCAPAGSHPRATATAPANTPRAIPRTFMSPPSSDARLRRQRRRRRRERSRW